MGPAATLCASSGLRLACQGPRGPALSTEGPLSWEGGVWWGLRRAFLLRVSGGGSLPAAPRQTRGPCWSMAPRGSCVCACVLSVRIYAKGAAPPVRLQAVEGGLSPDYAGRNVGLGARPGARAVEGSFCKCLLNTSSRWAVTFPAALSFWSRNPWAPSPASARADGQVLRHSVPRSCFLETLAPGSPAGKVAS